MHFSFHKLSVGLNSPFLSPKSNLITAFNKYQADLYILESCHQMTNYCLLVSGFLPIFDCFCVEHKIVLQYFVLVQQTFSNLGKFSEIKIQYYVKSWLTY